MLRTVNETRDDVRDFIRRYNAFKRNDVENILNRGNGGVFRIELETLADAAKRLGQEGRSYLTRPNIAAAITEDEMHDLVAITEEMELAGIEGEAAADPDEVFARMPKQRRKELTERVMVDPVKADRLRARIRGDLRKQQAPPSGPPATPGNPNA